MNQHTSVIFTIDLTNPAITILSPEASEYNKNSVIVSYTYSEESSSSILLDGVELTEVTNNSLITDLADGEYSLTIRAIDLAGNIGEATVTFVIDTIPPTIQLLSPVDPYYNTVSQIISWHCESDTILTVYFDGVEYSSFNNNTALGFTEGSHNITIVAKDAAGNEQMTSTIFTIDLTNPVITILSPEPQTYVSDSVTVIYTVNEAPSSVTFYLDGVELTDGTNDSVLTDLTEGEHNLTIQVIDLAGNSAQFTVTFSIELPTTTTSMTTTTKTTSESYTSETTTSKPQSSSGFGVMTTFIILAFAVVFIKRSRHY